ncbi:hypothetical protein HCN44_003367 [Aphidius gifuensis]|uniref:Uncharacterized protein n=1 Tax=Aphidius gifuensis TaxID=684658 RepID=A0A835CSF9_APHGI|nr:hypothetical protein HCN44_003367 [Aphidius gifuensis]
MTSKQSDKSLELELLNSMVDSTTESEYNNFHNKFKRVIKKGSKGLEYFNKNWHNIKTECTTWGMDQVVNLGNHSNNRMESNHSKIKNHDWMQPDDTLTRAVRNLNDWMVHRKEHQQAVRINDISKLMRTHLQTSKFSKHQRDYQNDRYVGRGIGYDRRGRGYSSRGGGYVRDISRDGNGGSNTCGGNVGNIPRSEYTQSRFYGQNSVHNKTYKRKRAGARQTERDLIYWRGKAKTQNPNRIFIESASNCHFH